MPDNRPYQLTSDQQQAIKKIDEHFKNNINPVCALQPGKGKTIVACEIIQGFRAADLYNIAIIIKAVTIKNPWIKELEAYNIPSTVIHGNERDEKYLLDNTYLIKKGNVLITTYDTALIDIDKILNMGGFDLIVYDELHTVINPKKLTQKSKQFACLSSRHILALTATPIQNTINDIGLINILLNNPQELTAIDIDDVKLEKSILKAAVEDAKAKNIVILFPENVNTSSDIVSSVRVSKIKKKKVILSIPLYDEMKDVTCDIMGDNEDDNRNPVNLQKLMSFLSHPDSIYKNNSVDIPHISCTKVDAVKIIVDKIPKNEKIIVFSQYVDVLNRYYKLFKDMGYDSLILTGKDRGVNVDRKLIQFNNIDSFKFLLTTIFKSSEGLNLEKANHVIILEFWWNPQKIIQAMGRIDRLNQTRNIFVYMLCYNEDGEIYKYEKLYLDAMTEKIKDAREIIPAQVDLPDVKMFPSQDTFKTEFKSYLEGFIPSSKRKVVVKKEKLIRHLVAEPGSKGKAAQPEKDEVFFGESFLKLWAQQSLPVDHRFDDLDLTGGKQDHD
jgi:superfamily II DNA or RNA helicase